MSDCRLEDINHDAFGYYKGLARLDKHCSKHFEDDVTLQQAANICALERTYFSRYFHQKIGVCFNCWFTGLRIDQAKIQMADSNASITRVAFSVGYKNLSSFDRAFKRLTGMSASKYKGQVRPS